MYTAAINAERNGVSRGEYLMQAEELYKGERRPSSTGIRGIRLLSPRISAKSAGYDHRHVTIRVQITDDDGDLQSQGLTVYGPDDIREVWRTQCYFASDIRGQTTPPRSWFDAEPTHQQIVRYMHHRSTVIVKPSAGLDNELCKPPRKPAVASAELKKPRKKKATKTTESVLLEWANKHPTKIVLLPSAKKSARKASRFQKLDTLERLLNKLSPRTFEYRGNPVYMPVHLRIGTSFSEAATLRMHFAWDSDNNVIVVGHCGKHLPHR